MLLTILPIGSFLGSLQLFLGIRDSGLDVRSNFLYFRVGIVHGAFRGNVLRINREIFLGFLQRFLGINEHFRFLIRNNRGTILLPPDRVTENRIAQNLCSQRMRMIADFRIDRLKSQRERVGQVFAAQRQCCRNHLHHNSDEQAENGHDHRKGDNRIECV